MGVSHGSIMPVLTDVLVPFLLKATPDDREPHPHTHTHGQTVNETILIVSFRDSFQLEWPDSLPCKTFSIGSWFVFSFNGCNTQCCCKVCARKTNNNDDNNNNNNNILVIILAGTDFAVILRACMIMPQHT